jgi:hypothetical protein
MHFAAALVRRMPNLLSGALIVLLTLPTMPQAGISILPTTQTLVAYSSSPGQVAFDGVGEHSPFAEAFAAASRGAVRIEEILDDVARSVSAKTGGKQLPTYLSNLEAPFVLSDSGRPRFALVIGNGRYLHLAALKNPASDAELISEVLSAQGFTVTRVLDVGYADMVAAISKFASTIPDDAIALFFFAGQGVAFGGENYLVPIDARAGSAEDVRFGAVSLNFVLREVARPSVLSAFIIDASRYNPFLEHPIDPAIPAPSTDPAAAIAAEAAAVWEAQKSTFDVAGLVDFVERFPGTPAAALAKLEIAKNTVTAEPVESTATDIDRILAELYLGAVEIEWPDSMIVGVAEPVSLTLTRSPTTDADALLKQLEHHFTRLSETTGQDLSLPNVLAAEVHGSGFEIVPITAPDQIVSMSRRHAWTWSISPSTSGAQRLYLTVSAKFGVDNTVVARTLAVNERAVDVQVNLLRGGMAFLERNWTFIVGTFVIPLVVWGWRMRVRRVAGAKAERAPANGDAADAA